MSRVFDDFQICAAVPWGNLFVPNNSAEIAFDYTDGHAVESFLYRTILDAKDVSAFSQDLLAKIVDWPSEYHLSPQRHNLLRHFEFSKTDKVLELGSGCGALTRYLGETGAEVHAVEGSAFRAQCTAARCRDLPNVRVLVSPFQDIKSLPDYDYVVMVGSLEYSPLFFPKSVNPIVECLEIAKRSLRPAGQLILAIENRLGLKYFAGAREDHTGEPYAGIHDTYTDGTPLTLGRVELETALKSAGFNSMHFEYPFPDYKLPVAVFSEGAFLQSGFAPVEIIRRLKLRSADGDPEILHFSEALAWPTIAVNQLVPSLANSFLVVASSSDKSRQDPSLLGTLYTTDRRPQFNTRTQFRLENGSELIVDKEPLELFRKEKQGKLIHLTGREPYIQGKCLEGQIQVAVKLDRFANFLEYICKWLEFLYENALLDNEQDNRFSSNIKGIYIDCLPDNLIYSGDDLVYIDKEWQYDESVKLSTLVLRYLVRYTHSEFVQRNIPGKQPPLFKLANLIGLQLNEKVFRDFLEVEDNFFRIIHNHSRDRAGVLTLASLYDEVAEPSRGFVSKAATKIRKLLERYE